MKVKVFDNRTDVASIKDGECFLHKGLLYMKLDLRSITNTDCASSRVGCALLTTGGVTLLDADTQVEAVDCTIRNTNPPKTDDSRFSI